MIGYEVEIVGLQEQIALLKAYDEIAEAELIKAMREATYAIEFAVKSFTPVDTGLLHSKIGSEVINLGTLSIVGRVGPSLKDEIYPQVMEFGLPPGTFPPPEALVPWVHRVIRPEPWKEYSVAFNVARKIYHRGIKPRHYLKKGFEAARATVERVFAAAMERIAKGLENGN